MTNATKKTSKVKAWAYRNPQVVCAAKGAGIALCGYAILVVTAYATATIAIQHSK